VVIDQVLELDGKQYLVRMDEELEYGDLKRKLATQFHVAPHELVLSSDSGEIRDWETPKSVGRPAVIKIGKGSSSLPVAPPAAPAVVSGTKYRFLAPDGRLIATLPFDVDDTFAAVCQQISALTGWRRVKCSVRTSSGLSEIDADTTFDDVSDLLNESRNTLIAEERR
jgi:hypothetical protein